MNKKLLMFGIASILGIMLVSAAIISYYYFEETTVNVTQAVTASGVGSQTVNCISGESILSVNPILINNVAPSGRNIIIGTEQIPEDYCVISTEYVGKMVFAGKDLLTGDVSPVTKEVTYTVTGDNFVATGIPIGYKLIYYPDMEGGFTENVANIKVYGEDTFPSLPILEDIGDDYCNIFIEGINTKSNPNAVVCNGAKLWLVKEGYVDALKTGVWTPSEIMFETDLITYTDSITGEVLIPEKSTITIYPKFNCASNCANGTYMVNTTVLPA